MPEPAKTLSTCLPFILQHEDNSRVYLRNLIKNPKQE
jgi:hypothetical protein